MLLFILLFNFINITSVSAASISINIPEKYTNVHAGDRFYFKIEIKYPENQSRKDLKLDYEIFKGDKLIAQSKILKAVETQLSFVDSIVIPDNTEEGLYLIKAKVSDYEDFNKEVSASFRVSKPKGIQIKNYFLIVFWSVVLIGLILLAIQIHMAKRLGRRGRFAPHEYPDIPRKNRMFYEIISDIIGQMRYRVGDRALDIAKNIECLVIDEKDGKVIKIKKSPEKIIALLILEYEKHLGKKISFALRKPSKETKGRLAAVEKNLIIVRKYFE